MTAAKPQAWAHSHLYWLALSRWDNEGGANSQRPVVGVSRLKGSLISLEDYFVFKRLSQQRLSRATAP